MKKKSRVHLKDNPEYKALLEDMRLLNQEQVDRVLDQLNDDETDHGASERDHEHKG